MVAVGFVFGLGGWCHVGISIGGEIGQERCENEEVSRFWILWGGDGGEVGGGWRWVAGRGDKEGWVGGRGQKEGDGSIFWDCEDACIIL